MSDFIVISNIFLFLNQNIDHALQFGVGTKFYSVDDVKQIMVNMGLPWECFYALSFTNMSKIKIIQK